MHQDSTLFPRQNATDTTNENVIIGVINAVGPLFVAYLISWALYGILSVQSYVYYLAFPKDKPLHKWLVLAVYLLETADIIIMTYDAMSDFRNVFELPIPGYTMQPDSPMQYSWFRIYILGGIVTCIVQFFYAYHLNTLQHPRVVTATIIVTAFIQCCGSIVAGALQARHNFYITAIQTKIPVANYVFAVPSVICSLLVSAFMVYRLMWKDTEWQPRHPMLPKLIRVSVETGAVAAMASVSYFVLFFCHVHALNLMIPALVLSKIYANSLLVVFNSRVNIIRGRIKTPEVPRIDALVFPKSRSSAMTNSHGVETGARTVTSALTVDISTSYVTQRDSIPLPITKGGASL